MVSETMCSMECHSRGHRVACRGVWSWVGDLDGGCGLTGEGQGRPFRPDRECSTASCPLHEVLGPHLMLALSVVCGTDRARPATTPYFCLPHMAPTVSHALDSSVGPSAPRSQPPGDGVLWPLPWQSLPPPPFMSAPALCCPHPPQDPS